MASRWLLQHKTFWLLLISSRERWGKLQLTCMLTHIAAAVLCSAQVLCCIARCVAIAAAVLCCICVYSRIASGTAVLICGYSIEVCAVCVLLCYVVMHSILCCPACAAVLCCDPFYSLLFSGCWCAHDLHTQCFSHFVCQCRMYFMIALSSAQSCHISIMVKSSSQCHPLQSSRQVTLFVWFDNQGSVPSESPVFAFCCFVNLIIT